MSEIVNKNVPKYLSDLSKNSCENVPYISQLCVALNHIKDKILTLDLLETIYKGLFSYRGATSWSKCHPPFFSCYIYKYHSLIVLPYS